MIVALATNHLGMRRRIVSDEVIVCSVRDCLWEQHGDYRSAS